MADTEQRKKDDKNPRDKSGLVAQHVLDTRSQDRVSGGLPAQVFYLLKVGKRICPGSLWNSGCPKHALYAQPGQVFLPCILAQGPIRHMHEGHVTVASRLQCKAPPHFPPRYLLLFPALI